MSLLTPQEGAGTVRAAVVDDLGSEAGGSGAARAGLRRFDRLFDVIIGAFGVLFALQTGDSFVADLPMTSNALGSIVIALILVAVLAGLVPIVARSRARIAFLSGVGLYAVALLLWPLTVERPIPTDPMPWVVAVWPALAAYAAQISTSRGVTIISGIVLSAYAGITLHLSGGLDPADAVVNSLFMAGTAVVLVLLLGVVRRGIVAAGEAQQTALAGFAASRIDEATETERKRTDALLHDAVLTTFLSAAAARTTDAEALARRMASNALRVLMHVNAVGRAEAAMPFGQAFEEAREQLGPLLPLFDVDLGTSESVMLPEDVARAIVLVLVGAASNSVQHGHGATRRTLRVDPLGPDGIRVRIEDDGCGFDPSTLRDRGPGGGRRAVQHLRSLEGRADVLAAPGEGVRVTVSWGSVVMVGTAPLDEDAVLAAERSLLP